MYEYKTSLVRVVDGDTVELTVDLGFTVTAKVVFRLLGINSPEMKGVTKSSGLVARQGLIDLLGQGDLSIRSEKPVKTDKYGRWLATITVTRPDGSTFVVNDEMIKSGFAVAYTP